MKRFELKPSPWRIALPLSYIRMWKLGGFPCDLISMQHGGSLGQEGVFLGRVHGLGQKGSD